VDGDPASEIIGWDSHTAIDSHNRDRVARYQFINFRAPDAKQASDLQSV